MFVYLVQLRQSAIVSGGPWRVNFVAI